MKSEQLYIIAIVVVLLVILFIYNVMNGTPPTTNQGPGPGPDTDKNQKPVTSTIPTCSATVQILYTPATSTANGTLKMTVSSSTKSLSNSFSFPYNAAGTSGTTFSSTTAVTIEAINFDPTNKTYLNFWAGTIWTSDHLYIQSVNTIPKFSVADSVPNSTYDMSSVAVNNNIVTFTNSSSNTLTITFPTNFS